MLLVALLGCGPDIAAMYESERQHALTVAATAPDGWAPDLVLSAGTTVLEQLVTAQLQGAFDDLEGPSVGGSVAVPHLRVSDVKLAPSEQCAACLQLRVAVRGDISVTLLGKSAGMPVEGMVKGQLELGVEEGRRAVVRVRNINRVELAAAGFNRLGVGGVEDALGERIRALVASALPPIPLVDVGATGLPIRLLRVANHPRGVRVEVLTDVPGAGPAKVDDAAPDRLRLGLSETALTGLVRRAAFEQGLIPDLQVGVDPRRIDVDGDHFSLDLRLWRLVGAGWWRDYAAIGTLSVADGKLRLDVPAGGVKEIAASPGAGLVDPLAALFQSRVLAAIADNLDRSLPAAAGSKKGALRARAVATAVRGEGDTLVVDAELRTGKADR
jgi:hypothetical protein